MEVYITKNIVGFILTVYNDEKASSIVFDKKEDLDDFIYKYQMALDEFEENEGSC